MLIVNGQLLIVILYYSDYFAPFFTIHYSLFTIHYSLFTIHFSLTFFVIQSVSDESRSYSLLMDSSLRSE